MLGNMNMHSCTGRALRDTDRSGCPNKQNPIIFESCRIQSPSISRADRVGAAHGGPEWHGGAEQNIISTCRVAQKPTVPLALQSIVDNCPELSFASTNEGNPM